MAVSSSRPVVIFGASVLGKVMLDSLEILNIKPACFCDNDKNKQWHLFHGHQVILFEDLCSQHPNAIVIVAAGRYFDEIAGQLSVAGFDKIYSDSDVIRCIDFKKVPYSDLGKIIWHLPKIGMLSKAMDLPPDALVVPRLNVVVTSRCTLKCKHCSSLMTHYEEPGDFDTSRMTTSLDRIFSCIDVVCRVEVLGGEPFLNRDTPLIVKHLLDSGKVLHVDVVTNGTILPDVKVLEKLKDTRLSIVIDDYGALSKKLSSFSDMLRKMQIDYRVNKHWAWADLGDFESRNLSGKQLEDLFAKCNFNTCTELLDGRLYRCPRSSHGTNIGVIPEYRDDFINLLEEPPGSLKDRLHLFFHDKKFIHACNHCNGNTGNSLNLPPAEQLIQRKDR